MIVAVVIPALYGESAQKSLHEILLEIDHSAIALQPNAFICCVTLCKVTMMKARSRQRHDAVEQRRNADTQQVAFHYERA